MKKPFNQIQSKLTQIGFNPSGSGDAEMQLLECVLREAQVQHCEKKRERLANVLVAAWVSESPINSKFDESLLFLRATTAFGESHISILEKLHSAGKDNATSFETLAQLVSDPVNSRDVTLTILEELCSDFAFLKRAWDLNQPDAKSAILFSGNFSPEGIARRCFHAITERGVRYVDYVVRGRLPQ